MLTRTLFFRGFARRMVACMLAGTMIAPAHAGDILRGSGASRPSAAAPASSPTVGPAAGAAQAVQRPQDRLAKTTQALEAVRKMQTDARSAALAGPKNLGVKLPAVPNGLGARGLQPARGVPKDLLRPTVAEDPSLWKGANLPIQRSQTDGLASTTTVTIKQTEQQAVLNWESFSIGKETTLKFDQSLGGADVGQWIAFNKIGTTGAPSQILGKIQTFGPGADAQPGSGGQVYVVNPNGIIFGGSSQVNAHALVASSLPINDNLIQRGLLNNPDGQFLFSGLALPAGAGGTPAFTPTVAEAFDPAGDGTHELALTVSDPAGVTVRFSLAGAAPTTLAPNKDYTLQKSDTTGKSTVAFTADGLAKLNSSQPQAGFSAVTAVYTPTGDQYGNVEVRAGAKLSNEQRAGGRVALIGPNVTNQGGIATPEGQTVLAAGLQVGMFAHSTQDPTLRGIDVFVGAVKDPKLPESDPAGAVINAVQGLIEVPRGNVTLAGRNVQQLGVIASSTSVALNGRIDLLADYDAVVVPFSTTNNPTGPTLAYKSSGTVFLGDRSLSRIVPELSSTERVVGLDLALPSLVNVQGHAIHFGQDALLFAPSAHVSSGTPVSDNVGLRLNQGVTLNAGSWRNSSIGYFFANDSGQVYFDSGATIDVSGTQGAKASVLENIVEVQLRGPELANSPLQRDGKLRGQTVKIDARVHGPWDPALNGGAGGYSWIGTPLANTTGYVNLVQRGVDELTTAGGTVEIRAGASVVMQKNAAVDVSGGWTQFEGAQVATTKVLSGGKIYDVSQATPDRTYDGIYTGTTTKTDSKWGVTEQSQNPTLDGFYEPGYLQGANGGVLKITAPTVALDGTLLGQTTAGPRQRSPLPASTGTVPAQPDNLPLGSKLELRLQYQTSDPTSANGVVLKSAANPPAVLFQSDTTQAAPDAFKVDTVTGEPTALRRDRQDKILLSPDLLERKIGGFSDLLIDNSDGNITLASRVTLNAAPGSKIELSGANLDLRGQILAPGGKISLQAFNSSPYVYRADADRATPAPTPGRGLFTLGADAILSTSGLIVDDRLSSGAPGTDLSLTTAGGTITIASYAADFLTGSTLDVSGGAHLDAKGKVSYGRGGVLSLQAGRDLLIPAIGQSSDTSAKLRPRFNLDPKRVNLRGFSGGEGATLSVLAPSIQIGGALGKDNPDTWLLSPDFFNAGGFSHFELKGLGRAVTGKPDQYLPGILVAGETAVTTTNAKGQSLTTQVPTLISPQVQNWVVGPGDTPTGVSLKSTVLPVGTRAPVSIQLQALGVADLDNNPVVRGDVVVEEKATFDVGPRGSVELRGGTFNSNGSDQLAGTVAVFGKIFAPGGKITVQGGGQFVTATTPNPVDVLPTVDLGPKSLLSTAGTTVLRPDARTDRLGEVINGGDVTVRGNIVAEAGAKLDVSGTRDQVDVVTSLLGTTTAASDPVNGSLFTRVWRESDGGSLHLAGAKMLVSDATLLGAPGGKSAAGGSLFLSSGRALPASGGPTELLPTDATLVLTQTGPHLPDGYSVPGKTAVGRALLDSTGKTIFGVDGSGASIPGLGLISASDFTTAVSQGNYTSGGFDSLSFAGTLQYSGSVQLSAPASITLADGGALVADPLVKTSSLSVAAPYVRLGRHSATPLQDIDDSNRPFVTKSGATVLVPPTYGSGSLSATAKLIDVGNLSLQNIGEANLVADAGEIRGHGSLEISGHLGLTAGQIYPPTASTFTLVAFDYLTSSGATAPGLITIGRSAGNLQLPLSAGGELKLFASNIEQGGVLRAPFGTLQLGWDVSAPAGLDPISGLPFPITQRLTLAPSSVTSVSAIDPKTGQATTVPYGVNVNGTAWIDPKGNDITISGLPRKNVSISAVAIEGEQKSNVDLRGGGDLYFYRFVKGTGGDTDVLETNGSFAILPGFESNFAPYAPFNSSTAATNLIAATGAGYSNDQLLPGDRIYLQGNDQLSAGAYTLLPARYALLPGAFLVTPKKTELPSGPVNRPDGSLLVSGYRYNALNAQRTLQPFYQSFEIAANPAPAPAGAPPAPKSVVRSRAQYDDFFATGFMRESAEKHNFAVPRLPVDSGQLLLTASKTMTLDGSVSAKSVASGGLGGLVDISTAEDVLIAGPEAATSNFKGLVLDSTALTNFGAESLLIGGRRSTSTDGTAVNVTANQLTVDNAGAPLAGTDIILVGKKGLTVSAGAVIQQSGALTGAADVLRLGEVDAEGKTVASGDGLLLRVTSDRLATVNRVGVTPYVPPSSDSLVTPMPSLTVGAHALIKGEQLTLDSTYGASLDPKATLTGSSIFISAGRIGLQLDPKAATSKDGLLLSSRALQTLQTGTKELSLLSYSTIDTYGAGQVGSAHFAALSLHAASIRGFGLGPDDTAAFVAQTLTLDNRAQVTNVPSPTTSASVGQLLFDAQTMQWGQGQLGLERYASAQINAAKKIVVQSSDPKIASSLSVQGNLTANTPLITADTASNYSVTATGDIRLLNTGPAATTAREGLGANLTFQGASVTAATQIVLPSGALTLRATGTAGAVDVGSGLDVGGVEKVFQGDLKKYTSGGRINLWSDAGSVRLTSGAALSLSARPEAGDAGVLTVAAPNGFFAIDPTARLEGQAGMGGKSGIFSLDVGQLEFPSEEHSGRVGALNGILNTGGFAESRSFRVRTGDVIVDGTAKSRAFALSADRGSIFVTGTIDASGPEGGNVRLAAQGDLILAKDTGVITVAGSAVDAARKGGAIALETRGGEVLDSTAPGGKRAGAIDLQSGSKIDLSVAASGSATGGTLRLRAPQIVDTTNPLDPVYDVGVKSVAGQVIGASSIAVEGYKVYQPLGGIIDLVEADIDANGRAFASAANRLKIGNRLFGASGPSWDVFHLQPGAEVVNPTGASSTVSLTLGRGNVTPTIAAGSALAFPQGSLGSNKLIFSSAVKVTALEAGTATLSVTQVPSGASGISIPDAGWKTIFAVGTGTATIQTDVPATITLPGGATQSLAAKTPVSLAAGSAVTLSAKGSITASATVGTVTVTRALPSGASVDLPAGTNVVLSDKGGYATLGNVSGTVTFSSASTGGISDKIPVQFLADAALTANASTVLSVTDGANVSLARNGTLTLAKDTWLALPLGPGTGITAANQLKIETASAAAGDKQYTMKLAQGGSLVFSSSAKVTVTKGGMIELPLSTGFTSTNPIDLPPEGGVVSITTVSGTPKFSTNSANAYLILPDGTRREIAADEQVALIAGSKIVLASAGKVFTDSTVAQNVTAAQNLVPNTVVTVPANRKVTLYAGADIVNVATTGAATLTGTGAVSLKSDQAAKVTNSSAATGTSAIGFVLTQGSDPYTLTGTGNTIAAASGFNDLKLQGDWDVSGFRYGANADWAKSGAGEPGVLTLRAQGNLVFNGALSDGFEGAGKINPATALYQSPLLPAGSRSWSYRLTAGADLTAADVLRVLPIAQLMTASGLEVGSLKLGRNGVGQAAPGRLGGSAALTSDALAGHYQVIRTGTGDIDVAAGRDVQLLNPFATIYTAGSKVGSPTDLPTGSFDLPILGQTSQGSLGSVQETPYYSPQYATGGGNISIAAQRDIIHLTQDTKGNLIKDSEAQMPTHWLERRGYVDANGNFGSSVNGDVMSTTWWVDYSNFFEGVGALGGGNVALTAGRDVSNVDAVVPTNARAPGRDKNGSLVSAATAALTELGGGNLVVAAQRDIDAGVYYVERGQGSLRAGGSIKTNATRYPSLDPAEPNGTELRLPTTLFLGKGGFEVSALRDLLLGPVANPFLLPQSINNTYWYKTYFTTYDPTDEVKVSSLTGNLTFRSSGPDGNLLARWYDLQAAPNARTSTSYNRPWLRLTEFNASGIAANFNTAATLMPGTLRATTFSADITLAGNLLLSPAAKGTIELAAAGSINALAKQSNKGSVNQWVSSRIILSDTNPNALPGVGNPLSLSIPIPDRRGSATGAGWQNSPSAGLLGALDRLFDEKETLSGQSAVLQTKQALHAPGLLHAEDTRPAYLYAESGDISGLTFFSAKTSRIAAGTDLGDVALYIQNNRATDETRVSAGRDITLYAPNSPLRTQASTGNNQPVGLPLSGDIQVGGPGLLSVVAGRNLDLGAGRQRDFAGDVGTGISTIGNARNPSLPQTGAAISVAAGLGNPASLESRRSLLDYTGFVAQTINPGTAGTLADRYLPELRRLLGLPEKTSNAEVWQSFVAKNSADQDRLVLNLFYIALRDSGRDRNDTKPENPYATTYHAGYAAVATFLSQNLNFADFIAKYLNPNTTGNLATRYLPDLAAAMGLAAAGPAQIWEQFNQKDPATQSKLAAVVFGKLMRNGSVDTETRNAAEGAINAVFNDHPVKGTGDIALSSREIRTRSGGDIALLAPAGGVSLGFDLSASKAPPGIITEAGGGISIYSKRNVEVGVSRIFTLRGGNEIIWSTLGNIAAGSSAKTVQTAPPTRVLIDPQSGDVKTDLAGLATGGGIGVLASVKGIPPGDVDLIAPVGAIDAGDAGIRSTGNLNVAARVVINASNIQVGGTQAGTPPPVAPPNIAPLAGASNASAAASTAASDVAKQGAAPAPTATLPSLVTVEVLGYGGGEEEDDAPPAEAPPREKDSSGETGAT